MYTFTNKFGSSELKQRIGMMNQRGSGPSVWVRYALWAAMLGIMVFACRHRNSQGSEPNTLTQWDELPATNATYVLANALQNRPSEWVQDAAMIEHQPDISVVNGVRIETYDINGYPSILRLQKGKLALYNTDIQHVKIFINGQRATAAMLETTDFANVANLFIYRKWAWQNGEISNERHQDDEYQILLSTTHENKPYNRQKKKWERHLRAHAAGGSMVGNTYTFTMNQLLEATFFHNKHALVERTKDDYLMLPATYQSNTDTYINGLVVKPDAIKSVHIREVNRVYTAERPFDLWSADTNPEKRYILYIETAPERAKRDSTYYVFSPFYSGDF